MARVLISYISRYGDNFYIDIEKSLLHEGNDVFTVNWHDRYSIKNN